MGILKETVADMSTIDSATNFFAAAKSTVMYVLSAILRALLTDYVL